MPSIFVSCDHLMMRARLELGAVRPGPAHTTVLRPHSPGMPPGASSVASVYHSLSLELLTSADAMPVASSVALLTTGELQSLDGFEYILIGLLGLVDERGDSLWRELPWGYVHSEPMAAAARAVWRRLAEATALHLVASLANATSPFPRQLPEAVGLLPPGAPLRVGTN